MSPRRWRPRAERMDLRHRSIRGRGSAAEREGEREAIRVFPHLPPQLLLNLPLPILPCNPEPGSRVQAVPKKSLVTLARGLHQCLSNCGM
jgi:hypothetical protein